MNLQEKCAKLLQELTEGIDAGDFADARTIPDKYTFAHLWALFQYTDALDGGREVYEQIFDLAVLHGKWAVQEKISKGERVKVAFLTISAAEWPAEEVYRLLERDERYESYVVVSPMPYDRDRSSMLQTYEQTCSHLKQSGHDVREIYDVQSDTGLGWEAIGGMPDVIIHLTSWYYSLLDICQIEDFPLKCLNCYIPYGFNIAENADRTYARCHVYDSAFTNFCFRVFVEAESSLLGYQSYGVLRGKNAVYSGYPKMDYFLDSRSFGDEEISEIWKVPAGIDPDKMKRVIIAPHHSILPSAGLAFATFHKNLWFLIYLAKKYTDKVSFLFKPHPNLRARVVQSQVFENVEAYDAYLEEWNKLPNARVMLEEDYRSAFATSDGMIMDSCSFVAEYTYVDKPFLFLRRDEQIFDPLGEIIMRAHYAEQGEDYFRIERFLQEVILEGKDTKREQRREIFCEELDYYSKNGCKASEYIYRDLCLELFGHY